MYKLEEDFFPSPSMTSILEIAACTQWWESRRPTATTCNGFDDFVSLVVAAVSSLEGDLVRRFVRGLEPRLQKSAEVSHHVLLKSFACSSHLK